MASASLFQPIRDPAAKAGSLGVQGSIAEIPALVHEILTHLPPGLPEPNVQVVSRIGVSWLGRSVWTPGQPNTTLYLQKSITGDAQSLKRIIAHELIHHAEYLTKWLPLSEARNLNGLMRIEGSHGRFFREWATKLNAIYGQDFVSETSDAAIVEEEDRAFYVLLKRRAQDGKIMLAQSARPSLRQKEYVNNLLTTGEVPRLKQAPGDYKLVRTRDRACSLVGPIGKGFWSFQDADMEKKLQDLWENAPGIPRIAALAGPDPGDDSLDREDDMAVVRKTYTQSQVLGTFRGLFPEWSVELSGSELMALSPANLPGDWTMAGPAIDKLRSLSAQLSITVTTQRRAGRLLVTMDLQDLPR